MGDILVCPKCHERLWVGDIQIPLVTCPKCLARVVNRNAAREAIAHQSVQTFPRQVIPVDSEAEGDIWGTNVLLRTLAAALVGAGILVIKMFGMSGVSAVLIVAGIATAGLTWVLRRKTPKIDVPPVYLQAAARGGEILEYASMPPEKNVGAFVGGFILALTFCFAVMIGIFTTPKPINRALAITAAVVGVAAVVFCAIRASERQQKGFYSGVMSGLILGALSCGPCSLIVFE